MFFSSRIPRLFLFIGLLMIPLVISGCFWEKTSNQRSQAGYFAEDFLPEATPFVVSYSTLDKEQKDTFATLKAKFSQLADQSVEQKFFDVLGFNAWNFGTTSFSQQLPSFFSNGTRITFALDSLPKQASATSDNLAIPGKYMFAVVNDVAAVKSLLDKVSAESNGVVTFSVDPVTQTPLYEDSTDHLFVGLVGDLFVVTDNEILLKDVVARGVQKGASLSTSAVYKNAMSSLPSSYIASLYVASDGNFLQALSASTSDAEQSTVAEGFVFVAKNDGLKIEGSSKADDAALKSLGFDRASFIPNKLTLINKLPGQNVVFASEAKNLGGMIDFLMKSIAKQKMQSENEQALLGDDGLSSLENEDSVDDTTTDTNTDDGNASLDTESASVESTIADVNTTDDVKSEEAPQDFYVSFKEKFKNFMELDWDTDVLTFLNQNYVFAVSAKPGSIIPGITIMADASGNADGAQKFITKIDTQLEGLLMILRLNAGTEGTDLFLKDTVDVGGAEAHRISVDFSKLSALTGGDTVPDVISSQKFELTYGVTKDNVFFLSTYPDFASSYNADVLSNQDVYKKVADYVDLKNGVFFMVPAVLNGYLDTVVSFEESLKGPLSPEDKNIFDQVKSVLQVFQSVILTAEFDGDEALTHGYVLIGQ